MIILNGEFFVLKYIFIYNKYIYRKFQRMKKKRNANLGKNTIKAIAKITTL